MMATDDGKSRVRDDPCQSAAGWRPTGTDLSRFLTNLVGRHRTQASMLDNRLIMTWEYGLQRTGQTLPLIYGSDAPAPCGVGVTRLEVRTKPTLPETSNH